MSTPLEFLKVFAARLSQARVGYAITSGMACVFYGLQQTTKDSDLVIALNDLPRFLELLGDLEHEMPPWRVSYRVVFGAPLKADYMAHGWTSHFSLWDRADSYEHHVDLFCKPPRVARVETGPENDAFASRHMVAQMKHTDRERDPIGAIGREVLYERALRRAVVRADSTAEKMAKVQPALAEVLP